jgi:Heterokaryon incompatibility protein (HET)
MRSLSDLKQSEMCPFCNITIAAFYQISETDQDDFPSEEGDTFSVYWRSVPVGEIPTLRIRKPNRLKLGRSLAHQFQYFDFDIYLCLLDDLYFETVLSDPWIRPHHFDGQNLFRGRIVNSVIDYSLSQAWLDICMRNHKSCESKISQEARLDIPLTLIDVIEKQLVLANAGYEYVALSYVWGGQISTTLNQTTKAQLFKPGGLSEFNIPATISDAMVLCKAIGQRYLWVDALCIQQDDPIEVGTQVSNMGLVYELAVLTIVNASSAKDLSGDSPLPGVRPNSREIFQHVENVGRYSLILLTRPTLPYVLLRSRWRYRAWTLQEECFSNRLLILSEKQAFFLCQENQFCEDTVYESVEPGLSISNNDTVYRQRTIHSTWNMLPPHLPDTELSVQGLRLLLENYSRRELSHRADRIAAVTGVLGHYNGVVDDLPNTMLWGLPTVAFDFTLCWESSSNTAHNPSERNPEFPSWSWAAWIGSITFPLLEFRNDNWHHPCKGQGCTRSVLDCNDTRAQRLLDHYGLQLSPRAASEREIQLYYEKWGAKYVLSTHDELNDPRIKPSSYLYFTTSTATLWLEPTLKFERSKGYDLKSPDDPSHKIGTIHIEQSWADEHPDGFELEFIVILAIENHCESYHPTEKPYCRPRPTPAEEWKLALMGIQWTSVPTDTNAKHPIPVATRVAMTRLDFTAEKWMSVKPAPKEKFIMLG